MKTITLILWILIGVLLALTFWIADYSSDSPSNKKPNSEKSKNNSTENTVDLIKDFIDGDSLIHFRPVLLGPGEHKIKFDPELNIEYGEKVSWYIYFDTDNIKTKLSIKNARGEVFNPEKKNSKTFCRLSDRHIYLITTDKAEFNFHILKRKL